MSKQLDVSFLLDYYGDLLTDKQRAVAELYYNEDLSLAEIAEIMEISRQGVHDSVRRTEKILRRFEEHVGLLKRTKAITQQLEKINLLALEIQRISEQRDCGEIHERAVELLSTIAVLEQYS